MTLAKTVIGLSALLALMACEPKMHKAMTHEGDAMMQKSGDAMGADADHMMKSGG